MAPSAYQAANSSSVSAIGINITSSYRSDQLLNSNSSAARLPKVLQINLLAGDSISISKTTDDAEVLFTPVVSPNETQFKDRVLHSERYFAGEDLGAGVYTFSPKDRERGIVGINLDYKYFKLLNSTGELGEKSLQITLKSSDSIDLDGLANMILTSNK